MTHNTRILKKESLENKIYYKKTKKRTLNFNDIKNIKKYENIKNIALYSIFFAVISLIICTILHVNGYSLVYKGDALSQHYPSQFYLFKTLNVFLKSLGSDINKFNFNLGLGQDSLFTYYYYGLFDPMNLLFLPFSNVDTKLLYSLRIFTRLYASGLSFMYLCYYFKKDRNIYIISLASIIYIFSNFAISSGVTHPYFNYSMILLPLMIVSVNKLINERKIFSFIFFSFLTIIINFYFAYIIAVEVMIYAITIVVLKFNKSGVKKSIQTIFIGISSYLFAVLLSSFVTLPMLYGFLNSLRNSSVSYETPLLTRTHILFRYIFDFFKNPTAGDAVTNGVSIIVLFAIVSLFINKEKIQLKVLCILSCVAILFPHVQSALTGFAYANYRWNFAVTLLVTYIFVEQFETMVNTNGKKRKLLLLIASVYMIFYVIYSVSIIGKKPIPISASYALFALDCLKLVTYFALIYAIWYKRKNNKKWIIAIVMISLCFSGGTYATKAIISKVIVKNSALEKMTEDKTLISLSKQTKNTFDRVDNFNSKSMNFSDIYNYPSTSVYYSIENKNFSNFNLEMKNSKAAPITNSNGFDSRTLIDSILSVKYYVGNTKIPYGFEKTYNKRVYENKYFIPFGFTYDSYVNYKDIESRSSLDKQEIMIKSCILENDAEGILKNTSEDFITSGEELNFKSSQTGIIKSEKPININFSLSLPRSGELYLKLPGQDTIKNVTSIVIDVDGKKFSTVFTPKTSRWHVGEKDVLINIGNFEKGSHNIRLITPTGGQLDTEDIKFELRNVDIVKESSQKLSANYLENMKIKKDSFEGEISLPKEKLLFISIPYDIGWSARVDGKETSIKKANIGFMAINVKPGNHNIEFKYERPYQKIGILVSAISSIILIMYFAYKYIIKKKRK
ncbi:YfhO family protein [Peptostreptococcus faecalis]|uniref:YfhO family protein n=1 Tax=Peptostreptococcus faecalis TaxID=2045015 RepID=UPI000C7E0988|nr:YfhO family protein [Peptostreptococcus faecalis]